MAIGPDRQIAERFLIARGAERIPHPGGTLHAHLTRVADLLNSWSAPEDLELAGLCHAVYGTDGFAASLVDVAHRESVVEVIGSQSEAIIYVYASADRSFVYPQMGTASHVVLRDRFTGSARELSEPELRAFLELTAANELDVVTHSPDIAARHGRQLRELISRTKDWLSPKAAAAWEGLELVAVSSSAALD
jgi:hypothetical protein